MVEGNTRVITTMGKSSSPNVACDDRKPPTHNSVRLSVVKVKPMSLYMNSWMVIKKAAERKSTNTWRRAMKSPIY